MSARRGGSFGEVIRSLGTGASATAVSELLDQAWSERSRKDLPASPAELDEIRELLNNPELRDQFSPELKRNLEAFVRGNSQRAPARTVLELVPDLERLQRPEDVPGRFTTDYLLVLEQLTERPE